MTMIRQPDSTFSLVSADQAIANTAQKVLLIGQKTAAGAATTKTLHTEIGNDGYEDLQFGSSSQLAEMVRAFKRISTRLRVDAICLDDAAGTAADFLITFTGTATENGTYYIDVGSKEQHAITVPVVSGDAAADVAVTADAAIDLDTDAPFTPANAAGVLTLTAENDGTVANTLPVGIRGTVAGLTAVVTLDSAGATDPTITTEEIVALITTTRYQGVVWPFPAAPDELTDMLEARFNSDNDVLDGVAFTCHVDSYSNLVGGSYLGGLNEKSLVLICCKEEDVDAYMGPSQPEAAYVQATYLAAIRALRLTTGASISQYVTTRASKDQYGGTALCSLPYFNTVLPDMPDVAVGMGWTNDEIENLLAAGGAVMGVNQNGDTALLGEIVTTYLTDPAANADVTWTFLNYLDTASAGREYISVNVRGRFAQSRLTAGALTDGRDVVNVAMIEQYMDKLYFDLTQSDYMVAEAGEDALRYWKRNRTVELDLAAGLVTVDAYLPIVVQARRFQGTIHISFDNT